MITRFGGSKNTMQAFMRFAIFLLAASLVFAGSPKISKDLEGLEPGTFVDVIVQFEKAPSEADFGAVRGRGATEKKRLPLIKSGVFSLPVAALAGVANNPAISFISPDRPVQASLDYAVETLGADIALDYGWDGDGIGVAIIDSGVYAHEDLEWPTDRVVYQEGFIGRKVKDEFGHGTHVAGIVAGSGNVAEFYNSTKTFHGVAPGAKLLDLRVLDANGQGTDSGVIAAIQRAIELKDQYNVRVINLSLGRPVFESYTTDPLCQAVEAAWNAGIVVVAAAGNSGRDNSSGTEGYGTIASPGNDPLVITVGAMKTVSTASRADDRIASYSAKGPAPVDHVVKPDIVAPGNRIISLLANRSTLDLEYPQNEISASYYTAGTGNQQSSDYFKLSGTSMATPMVSGAVALLLDKDPSLTPDQVKARLMKSASKTFPSFSTATDPVTGETFIAQYDIFTVGAGYLDVFAALNNTDIAGGSAHSPTAFFDPETGDVYVVGDSSAVWGTSAIWGTSAV